ncbi:MAG: ketoacyl-ACP synthase III [Ruminococcus flavefaciens]|nr:ketoacyl-ACP synthase III [Ruminococcus flavefaciens]
MFGQYSDICIRGIASAVPVNKVDNMELAEMFGIKRIKRQVSLTGIHFRHICGKSQAASDLASVAAEKLMKRLEWNKDEIRVLVFVTQSPDVCTPSTAMIIQKRLGIGEDCLVFDVNLGCTGYVSGLQIVAALLTNIGGKGLLLVGDGQYYEPSEVINGDTLLFGHGAAATALETVSQKSFCYFQKTDGKRHHLLTRSLNGEFYMDGNEILLFSLTEASQSIKDIKTHFQINEQEIDYYVIHQAQKLIVKGIADECSIAPDKILTSYEEYGNTSTASLPLTICHNVDKLQKKSTARILLSGFGIGLAWADVYVEIDTKNILPVIFTDYYYDD